MLGCSVNLRNLDGFLLEMAKRETCTVLKVGLVSKGLFYAQNCDRQTQDPTGIGLLSSGSCPVLPLPVVTLGLPSDVVLTQK